MTFVLVATTSTAWAQSAVTEVAPLLPQMPKGEHALNQNAESSTLNVTIGEPTNTPQVVTSKGGTALKVANDFGGKVVKGTTMRKAPRLAAAPPSGATVEEWNISTNFYNGGANNGSGGFIDFTNTIYVAIDGNDIYIKGLDFWIADAWVQGTINGTTAVFESGQLFGTDSDGYSDYLVGFDVEEGEVVDITFNYSTTAHKLTLADNLVMLIGSDTSGGYYAYHINTVIAKESVPPPVEIEVGNGTNPSQIVPVYGAKYNSSTTSQMIYPASMLTNFQTGQKIKSVTFYTNDDGIQFSGGQITATIGTTTSTYFTNRNAVTISGGKTGTVVPTRDSKTLKIEFADPLVYTAGSNIVIQLVNTTTGSASATTWYGVQYTSGNTYYSYSSRGRTTGYLIQSDAAERFQFMPKATFELQSPPALLTDVLDFGVVQVGNGNSKTLTAYVENPNSTAVTATVTATAPFSVQSLTMTLNPGPNEIAVTFTPTAPDIYNGTLTVNIDGTDATVILKGIGQVDGPQATRDEEFFEGITYKWTDSIGGKHTSTLAEIATDPDQMIAMIRKVYMDRTIPGNYKRGFTATGANEVWNDVNYAGVGTISKTIENSTISFSYEDGYGWNIPGRIKSGSQAAEYYNNYGTFYYSYMDSTQYKPYNEGVTLLLLEMVDDFNDSTAFETSATGAYNQLRDYISHCIKSIRIVPGGRRTGTGFEAGTLFKIDCDKMNKFYLMAKGQLRWINNSYFAEYKYNSSTNNLRENFSANPCYIYCNNSYNPIDGFFDDRSFPLFFNMFEEFSPVANDAAAAKADIYQELVNLDVFGVEHDCMGVPLMGHQFMMYGKDSPASDCQDVRDLLFFVPDYRMMKWDGREKHDKQKFMNYYHVSKTDTHQPTMGLFVIRQDTITATVENDAYYRLQLNWRTNLTKFLPSDDQKFYLYQLVTDDNGVTTYVPVYYRDNAGNYTDANGNPSTTPVPVELTFSASETKNYPDVWIERFPYSQQVTFAIRGQDVNEWLDLQESNQMSFIIPGTDPAEKLFLAEATNYSRYNPETEKNCYSNRMNITNRPGGLKGSNLVVNTTLLTLKRMLSIDDENPVIVAQAVVSSLNSNGGTLSITTSNQSPKSEFPNGKSEGVGAGYHDNESTIPFTFDSNGYMKLSRFVIYDNFTVDVSKNEHPSQYIYEIESNYTDETIQGTTAHSNYYRVPVYKTDSRIHGHYSLSDIENDTDHSLELTDVQFDAKVQYSSKTEILRYDAYRWLQNEGRFIINKVLDDDAEEDIAPTGIAGNQGGSYTASMNDVEEEPEYYYAAPEFTVNPEDTDKWAEFVDKKATNEPGAYVYAPVVEAFTFGKDVKGDPRTDYNTYGGPQTDAASGAVELSEVTGYKPLKSTYTWTQDGKTYAYYLILLDMNAKSIANKVLVPNGYDIYKVRMWRVVDESTLAYMGEQKASRTDRMGTDVLLEELTYPAISAQSDYTRLGWSDSPFATQEEPLEANEKAGTFGALDLTAPENKDVKIPLKFIVRAYITKDDNLDNLQPSSGAPRRVLSDEIPTDAKFYIVEKEFDITLDSSTPIKTGLESLNVGRYVTGVKYYNVTGQESDKPFEGINVVVTRYNDGSVVTSKVIK